MEGYKLTIHVAIDGVSLPMTVTSADEEEIIRKAAGNVNQLLIEVRGKYSNVPDNRYYDVMVMLKSEVKALSAAKEKDTAPVFEVLDDIEKDIDELLAGQ